MPKNEDRIRRDLEILGLELSASEDDKKKAFIKLALKLHPDRFSKNPDDNIKMRFHEVCKAYKRLITDHCSTADWNVDKSDEIFFSLLADSLQHNSKAALYGLFSELPNHKSHFQNDNEYRCKEDALDEDEDEDTEFNRLITILTNRLQNGKSLPAGLTQDKICKLKEDFMKHKEASKKHQDDEKSTTASKKPKPPSQVPVTKPKPKSKKQILAEQRRREKEMAKIAAELDEKKKKDEEKEAARKQLEEERQRKLEEEQRKMEEERKRLVSEAKKRKEREDRERELRQQKENERLDKLKKQQEEELRRKEEEKKRKAEEKAAKSKAMREAKAERDDKEKTDPSKKQQGNKRPPASAQQQYQPQYQQYQQQQQKYPREVPPRFLRQMQQRQQPTSSQSETEESPNQQSKPSVPRKEVKTTKEEPDYDSTIDESQNNLPKTQESRAKWTENSSIGNENWGQELSSGAGSLSDWGTANVTEDWDAPSESTNYNTNWTEPRPDVVPKEEVKKTELSAAVGTIGSEVKSGKIPKKDPVVYSTEAVTSSSGQFGAIGQPISTSASAKNVELPKQELIDSKTVKSKDSTKIEPVVSKSVAKEQLYKEIIEKKPAVEQSVAVSSSSGPPKNPDITKVQGTAKAASPKLTGWSGLDGFEPLPNYDSQANIKTVPQNVPSVVEEVTKLKPKVETVLPSEPKNIVPQPVVVQNPPKDVTADKDIIDRSASKVVSASAAVETVRESDEWGWTTASSKKTKQKTSVQPSASKDANAWMSRSLKQLLDMGFKREDAERALKENNGIIESAVSDLLSRTDTTTEKLQGNANQNKDHVAYLLSEIPKTDSKPQTIENRGTVPENVNRQQKCREKVEHSPKGSLTEVRSTMVQEPIGAPSKTAAPRASSSFTPKELAPSFVDSSPSKSKSVGVIGSPLPGSAINKPTQSQTQQGLNTANLDVAKGLLGSLEIGVSTQSPNQGSGQNGLRSGSQPPLHPFVPISTGTAVNPPLQSSLTGDPTQNARFQHIQQQLAQMRNAATMQGGEGPLKQRPSMFAQQQPPNLQPGQGPITKDPGFIGSGLPQNPNPGPQQSKLFQWTQSIQMDTKEDVPTTGAKIETDPDWSGQTATATDSVNTTIAPIGGPVTVDPVSAKWGVIAAPRLSPTPSEFKPGVLWKPKAERERDDRQPGLLDEPGELSGEEIDPKLMQEGNLNGSNPAGEIKPPVGVIRPPPGLVSANSFDLQTKKLEPAHGLLDTSKNIPAELKTGIKQWLSLTGLKPTVDYNSLRLFCQQYGIVLLYKVGQGSVFVCYESQNQAQDACKALNGKIIFDSNIVANLITEDEVPNVTEAKSGPPQPSMKPFMPPGQFPGMPPRTFWDSNGQIGPMNPAMNPNMHFQGPPHMAGMPPGGLLGLGPHLGQWGAARPDPLVNPSSFWPMSMQPQGLLNQVPGYGPWSTNNAQSVAAVNVTPTHTAVSPSTGTKLLPDGLFNATESM